MLYTLFCATKFWFFMTIHLDTVHSSKGLNDINLWGHVLGRGYHDLVFIFGSLVNNGKGGKQPELLS